MARFPDDKIKEIISAVKTIVKNLQSFFCEHTGYFMTEGRYFEASYKKSKELISLHEALIDSLKNYRLDPGKPVYENYFAPYTKEQQKNAKKTGYDLAYNLYRPHITLTRYREDGIPKDTPIFPTDLSFKADGICVYKADENGAVFELLESFNIK
jgi:2'-5' RNA ligase